MSEATFQALLSQLVRAALEGGLDPFALHRALSVASMEAVGECRCDLRVFDEGDGEPPF
jgi:hypothetical protein